MWVRATLALRQNRTPVLFVGAWLAANWAVFLRSFGMTKTSALLVALCLTKGSTGWPGIYQSFTEFVVFGLVIIGGMLVSGDRIIRGVEQLLRERRRPGDPHTQTVPGPM